MAYTINSSTSFDKDSDKNTTSWGDYPTDDESDGENTYGESWFDDQPQSDSDKAPVEDETTQWYHTFKDIETALNYIKNAKLSYRFLEKWYFTTNKPFYEGQPEFDTTGNPVPVYKSDCIQCLVVSGKVGGEMIHIPLIRGEFTIQQLMLNNSPVWTVKHNDSKITFTLRWDAKSTNFAPVEPRHVKEAYQYANHESDYAIIEAWEKKWSNLYEGKTDFPSLEKPEEVNALFDALNKGDRLPGILKPSQRAELNTVEETVTDADGEEKTVIKVKVDVKQSLLRKKPSDIDPDVLKLYNFKTRKGKIYAATLKP